MTSDDQVCTALFACQKALRRLPLPHRRGVIDALHSGADFEAGPVVRGELGVGDRRPRYTGNVGLVEGSERAVAATEACRKACGDLCEEGRARLMRGLMAWLFEPVSAPDVDEEIEIWAL